MLGSFHESSITQMSKNSFSAFDVQPEATAGNRRLLVKNTFVEKKPDRHSLKQVKMIEKPSGPHKFSERFDHRRGSLMHLSKKSNPLAISFK